MSLKATPLPIRVVRGVLLLVHLLRGVLIAALVFPWIKRVRRERHIRRWSARLLHILNVQVVIHGNPPHHQVKSMMFVANHISWLDIYALNQVRAVRFVAKSEVRHWPVIGWLAAQTDTLFIERGRRHDTGRVANEAANALTAGACLCFFPEGTTTDGSVLLPFKGSLMQAAIDADAQIWPLAIRYPNPDGSHNVDMAFAGETTLVESLLMILRQRAARVELRFGEAIPARGRVRRDLSEQAYRVIADLRRQ